MHVADLQRARHLTYELHEYGVVGEKVQDAKSPGMLRNGIFSHCVRCFLESILGEPLLDLAENAGVQQLRQANTVPPRKLIS